MSTLSRSGKVTSSVEPQMASIFLPVKMSRPIRWHLALPCLPVFEVDISTTLAGWVAMQHNQNK